MPESMNDYIKSDSINFTFQNKNFNCHAFFESTWTAPRPAVLVFPPWWGLNAFVKEKAQGLAALGYVGIAIDPYGNGKTTEDAAEAQSLMMPLFMNRPLLRNLLDTALNAVKSHAKVDAQKIAAIGFCFGGTCVLELALSGANVAGVVSFHGVPGNPWGVPIQKASAISKIIPSVLILHGYQDPLVPPDDITQLEATLAHAQADFEINIYGQVGHAFAYPPAHDKESKVFYDPRISQRAETRMRAFLNDRL